MARPQPASPVRKTPNFDFLFGRYSHSRVEIPYFQISMTFSDARGFLKLVSEMPGSASMEWQIEELFQRDIDWARVERKIVPYLTQEQQPQFFNSLTIALLPFKRENVEAFSDTDWQPPALENEQQFSTAVSFGPIRCGYWQEWKDVADEGSRLGQLAWNTQEICGIAIDGQHRLAAIKRVVASGGQSYDACNIPVILVVLDPALGYTGGATRREMIGTLRQLFIDLNKHAKIPSRARQILLDDRDPSSICVRAVVGNQLQHGNPELEVSPKRLPLSLIDWHSEQAKFETGPYVSTVLGLDGAVTTLLDIKPLHDMMAFDQISGAVDKLATGLDIPLDAARTRLEECREYERPFSFTDEELQKMATGFQSNWCNGLVHLLTAFTPYYELVERRRELGTLTPEFANWYALKERADEARQAGEAARLLREFEQHLNNRPTEPIATNLFRDAVENLEKLKSNRELAFLVVFQRAYLIAFRQLIRVRPSMVPSEGEAEPTDIDESLLEDDDAEIEARDIRMERANQLVDALNHIVEIEPDFLRRECEFSVGETGDFDRFWIGSVVQIEGPIDFTQAASKRASDILLLIGIFWIYLQNESELEYGDLMERADNASGGLDLKLQQCMRRLVNGDRSVAGRILRGREEELDEEKARAVILERARWVWDILSRSG